MGEMIMQIDITEIAIKVIQLLLVIMGTVITSVVVPWIKSKTNANQQELIKNCVSIAVQYVQQTMEDAKDDEKLLAAVERAESLLLQYGITFNIDDITAEIEAMIKNFKLQDGEPWSKAGE